MRKFTSFAMAMALGAFAFTANADLGTLNVVDPTNTNYLIELSGITVEWLNEAGEAVEIEFVNPQEGVTPTIPVTIAGNTYNAEVFLAANYGGAGFADGVDEDGDNEPANTRLVVYLESSWYQTEEEKEGIFGPYTEYVAIPGDYEFEIPAGLVQSVEGEEENEDENLTFTVYASDYINPSFNIAVGESAYDATEYSYPAKDLANVEMYWDSKIQVIAAGDETTVNLYKYEKTLEDIWGDGSYYYEDWSIVDTTPLVFETDFNYNADQTGFVFNLSGCEDGYVYMMEMPMKYVLVDNVICNTAPQFSVFVYNGMKSATILKPNNDYMSFVPDFMLTWDYQDITVVDAEALTATLVWEPGMSTSKSVTIPASAFTFAYVEQPTDEPSTPNQDPGEGEVPETLADEAEAVNVMRIDIATYVAELGGSGQFQLQLPEGLVVNADNLKNPPMDYTFYVQPLYSEDAIIDITSTGLMTIVFNGATNITPTYSQIAPTVVNEAGEATPVTLDQNGDMLTVNIRALGLEDGEYIFVLPEATVSISVDTEEEYLSYFNNEQFYTFTLENGVTTDVKALNSDEFDGVYRVYNLQGMKVLETTDASQLNNLKGLYIINGKKAIIK